VPFRDITGHGSTLSLLTRAVALHSLPPSLLFTGVAGIGKRRTALALAQTLNCAEPRHDVVLGDAARRTLPVDACGVCASCRRIERLVHPDVLVIEPSDDTGNIRVDHVRALTEHLGYRPFEARWRVVLIDHAEALVDTAQNALLKTLEEPPSSTVFVLVTSQPDDLLPTVRSRCPQIRFAPLSVADVASLLAQRGIVSKDAQALAAVSGGSVESALGSAAALLADARAGAARLLAELAAPSGVRARLAAAGAIAGRSTKGSAAGERESLATHLRALHALLRDVGVLAERGRGALVANADLAPGLERLTSSFDRDRLVRAFAAIDRALEALDGNASPKIVADWVVLHV
jgi:DNA polymerase-3 subunit delta'